LGKDDKTKALLDDLNKAMKNEQSYVLAVTYSSSKATEEIAGRTERTVGKTSEDVQRLTQTVESLSAAAKGISRTVKALWCTTAADNVYSREQGQRSRKGRRRGIAARS
jgi:uncharacterized protein YoxC